MALAKKKTQTALSHLVCPHQRSERATCCARPTSIVDVSLTGPDRLAECLFEFGGPCFCLRFYGGGGCAKQRSRFTDRKDDRPMGGFVFPVRPTPPPSIDRSLKASPCRLSTATEAAAQKKKTNSATSGKSRQNPDKTRYKPGNTPVGPVQSMKKKKRLYEEEKKLDQLTLKANSSPASRLCCV